MIYGPQQTQELLELIEKKDEGHGVEFVDHAIIQSNGYASRFVEEQLVHTNLTAEVLYNLRRMNSEGLVNEIAATPEGRVFELTSRGHKELRDCRKRTPVRRTAKLAVLGVPVAISVVLTIYSLLAPNTICPIIPYSDRLEKCLNTED
ncbi:hypothetical protein L0664_08655 [Octadecabacter sp. G9-8]|uniref:PadR family transcriptional regulator n=1 Tax=Octadecabacter dasysiphoniae TaxID=2909341 RepID=A0ABS9CWB0_9RHOB|nr:hypothetical protein [Octadecabacter dasysiphoniae]MCF2871134.1 hypothetical protein [Octadecabacter dasysiphoniae]